ncbi:death-associated protein kinase 1-like isoform X2 [Oscarella lobularis]|uniref:death-associated protein kinase 1-like isoform X2 n=1 Tax=Oscarella lobularis TaxID=121494 RepID=UPI0033133984
MMRQTEYEAFPLLTACKKDNVGLGKLLIKAGANVNGANGRGFPLLIACEKNNVDMAKLLINAGANVNEAKGGTFPLLTACENDNVDMARLLIKAGANVNETRWRTLPLLAACERDNVDMARLLIVSGANVNKGKGGRFPLLTACERDNVDMARLLIDAGANVNEATEGKTLLIKVSASGRHMMAEVLLRSGCNPNARDEDKKTALFYACLRCHYLIGMLLLKFCPNLSSDPDILLTIAKQHQSSSQISPDAVNLVKTILVQSPFLAALRDEDGRFLYELPCPLELRKVFFDFWVQYQYQELYAQGTIRPNKIKVCVIGEARAGKTTLIKSLRNVNWQEGGDDQRTASVDVTVADTKFAGELVFCDFAGQPFFHKTHGLFFSATSTIFLLVVDLNEDEDEMRRSSHYWASFVKCSVFLAKKAYVVVIGSKRDELSRSNLDSAETKLKNLVRYLQATFGQWFEFVDDVFLLNCREKSSKQLKSFQRILGEVKCRALKETKDVPAVVETAETILLPILRNPESTSTSPSVFQKAMRYFSRRYRLAEDLRLSAISVLKRDGLISDDETDSACIRFLQTDAFRRAMVQTVCSGLSDAAQRLAVDFLQAIGEILVIDDNVILNPSWLCQNVVGPLLSPRNFPIHLDSSASGTATKEKIKRVLEIFNKRKWESIDDTISLLRNLEICYPISDQADTYQFPALIEEQRPPHVWRDNREMTVYVGRRLMSEEITDIITPGTMPFIQSRVRNSSSFSPSKPVVWQGGLLIERTIDRHLVEGTIVFQDREKAIDFIVRGPEHSQQQCKKHLRDLMDVGTRVLQVKSPGTMQSLWYISFTQLKQLIDFPIAHRAETVSETIKISKCSTETVCHPEGIRDTLKDLLALPDDHFSFLPFKTRDVICKCLEKDSEGKAALAKCLLVSPVERLRSESAEEMLKLWSNNLEATIETFRDVARASGLLYLLAILNDCGALELPEKEKAAAQEDLTFFEANSAPAIAARRAKRLSGRSSTVASTDLASVPLLELDQDLPPTMEERIETAKQIQAVWRHIGRILGPEPKFKDHDFHECEQERYDRDRAYKMLEKWEAKHGSKATRRHLIDAMIREDYRAQVAEIFPGFSDTQ